MTIFLVERNGDVSVHQNTEMAGWSMESPDILDGEYLRAYDEKGNVFSISVPPESKANRMNISPGILTLTAEKDPAGLHEYLRRRFATDQKGTAPSLDELISLATAAQQAQDLKAAKRVKRFEFGFLVLMAIIAAALYALN